MLRLQVSLHLLYFGSFMERMGFLTTSTHAQNKHFLLTDCCVILAYLLHVNIVIAEFQPLTSIVIRSALHRIRGTAAILVSTSTGACTFDVRHIFT
jgi:hypothetical protein